MGELDWDADPRCGNRGRRGAPLRSVRRRGRGRRRERRLREVLGGRRSCAVRAHGRLGLEADRHRRPLRAEPGGRRPGQGAARPRHRERDEGGYLGRPRRLPYPPRELEAGLGSPSLFASYVGVLASIYPQVRQFVIGNEPNQPAFWRPQFDASGNNASAAAFGPYLAAAYDILKAVDPTISVLGVGLSPRGNDRPAAKNNISTSPVRFLRALGAWYRRSGRTRPLMDGFSFHPYPNEATTRSSAATSGQTPASRTSTA